MIRVKQAKIGTALLYTHENVLTHSFHFSRLANSNALIGTDNSLKTFKRFQQETGLADLYWRVLYYQPPGEKISLAQAMAEADGYVFFMHGWSGSHRIWEKLPFRLTNKYKKVVCFNLDVNGFGMSPFEHTPTPDQCSPPAIMAAIERWMAATGLWPAVNRQKKPFYLFVGHSMSGAALFYKDVSQWQNEAYGFYALAPALFCNDTQRKAFFKTIGAGIKLPSFTAVKDALAPHIIHALGTGASPEVKNEHLRIYNKTPFGTIAQVLRVLGTAVPPPQRTDWLRYKVALGHRDRVVGLDNMLDLLEELDFHPNQIRVTMGDHYFFSHGQDSPSSHKKNQQVIFDDLLAFCRQLSKAAKAL
jgi:hypothetical protein